MVPTFEQPSMPLLFELLFVFSDGFLFALVLYLLAAVYLDASPPAPYLGDRPNLFWAGANTATFSLKIFRREELIKILSPDPVYVWAILRTFLKFPQSGLHLSNLTTSHDKRFVTLYFSQQCFNAGVTHWKIQRWLQSPWCWKQTTWAGNLSLLSICKK